MWLRAFEKARRYEVVEEQWEEGKRDRDALKALLEQEKRRVIELTEELKDTKVMLEEQRHNLEQLTGKLMNRDSRVMHLEAEKYFLGADSEETRNEEAQLKGVILKTPLRKNRYFTVLVTIKIRKIPVIYFPGTFPG
jgi:hypothetical protein